MYVIDPSWIAQKSMGFRKQLSVVLLIISFVSWSLQIVMAGSANERTDDKKKIDYDELPFQWVFGKKRIAEEDQQNDDDQNSDQHKSGTFKKKNKNKNKNKNKDKDKDKDEETRSGKNNKKDFDPDTLLEGIPVWVRKLAFGSSGKISRMKEPKRSISEMINDHSN